MTVRVGVAFDGFVSTREAIELAERSVAAGAQSLWVAEHLGYREAIATCMAFALKAPGPLLVPTAVSPYLWHPTPTAMAALQCDKPVIAAVNGAAVGWGMDLMLFCDIRIASDRAKFGELFIKRGLVSDLGGLWRLPQIVGPSKAAELLFTGDIIDAAEAERIGLVSRVVPHDDLMPAALEMARKIAANPPIAMRFMKQGLRMSVHGDPNEIGAYVMNALAYLFTTEDHREGALSFVEKREPVFKGR